MFKVYVSFIVFKFREKKEQVESRWFGLRSDKWGLNVAPC
jgi:hypothetical protein